MPSLSSPHQVKYIPPRFCQWSGSNQGRNSPTFNFYFTLLLFFLLCMHFQKFWYIVQMPCSWHIQVYSLRFRNDKHILTIKSIQNKPRICPLICCHLLKNKYYLRSLFNTFFWRKHFQYKFIDASLSRNSYIKLLVKVH
jgi:hypothetical protein